MFYMAGESEDLSLDAASQINWETAPKRQIGEPRCIGVFATETRELEHQKITVNERKPHISNSVYEKIQESESVSRSVVSNSLQLHGL